MALTLTDVVALAKAGYKPADVKELIEMSNAAPAAPVEPTEPSEPVEPTEPSEPSEPTEPSEPVIDEKDVKIAELEKTIQDMQKANVNQSGGNAQPTDEDIINNALQGLLG